jgi:hypothetical protein
MMMIEMIRRRVIGYPKEHNENTKKGHSLSARTCSSSLVIGKISRNIFLSNSVAKWTYLKNQDAMETFLLCPNQPPIYLATKSNTEKMLKGFPYLYSGLSPPFA